MKISSNHLANLTGPGSTSSLWTPNVITPGQQPGPLGIEGWKTLTLGHCISSIFDNSRNNNGQAFLRLLLQGYTIAIITPMRKASTCGQVLAQWPLAQLQMLQNSGNVMFMLRAKTRSAQDLHWRNQRKKNYIEYINIKALVSVYCVLTGSAPRKMAEGDQIFLHSAGIEPISPYSLLLALTNEPWVHIDLPKKSVVNCHSNCHISQHWSYDWTYFLHAGLSFSGLNCSSWMSKLDTIYMNSWFQTFNQ